MLLHWQRSCWVIHMWEQADRDTMTLQPITQHGWTVADEKLTVVWDTPENLQAVRDRVKLLLRGCKCVTGSTTGRCGCNKNNRRCSEGCECKNCSNIATAENETAIADVALEEEYTVPVTTLKMTKLWTGCLAMTLTMSYQHPMMKNLVRAKKMMISLCKQLTFPCILHQESFLYCCYVFHLWTVKF